MFEILLIVGVISIMAKIANADDQSAILWGVVTGGLCLLSLLIPIPFGRILIAGVLAFVLMMGYKAIRGRR